VVVEAARTRYELRVGTHVSEATVASFHLAVHRTAVRRKSVYRFLVPTDRDLSDVLNLLTERDVQVLEIRRCPEPWPRRPAAGSLQPGQPPREAEETPAPVGAVVLPFRRGAHPQAASPPAGSAG
jgi:hypothetical protein